MKETLLSIVILATPGEYSLWSLLTMSLEHSSIHYFCFCCIKFAHFFLPRIWFNYKQWVFRQSGKPQCDVAWEIYAFEFLFFFVGVKNSKVIPTKSIIDRCENVINFEVVSKNTIKRDSSFNVYRQRKISFEDRAVVEGSKTASINQYGAGPRHPKTGHVDDFRNSRRN